MTAEPTAMSLGSEVVWHDAECGSYAKDLPLWERLASNAGGPVLELGAGTGRVALHLAARGHDVCAVELDPDLAEALEVRALERGVRVEVIAADMRELGLGERRYPLVIAPMQALQLVDTAGRLAALERARDALSPGGVLAAAVVEDLTGAQGGGGSMLPDVAEREGWVHSSLPLEVVADGDWLVVRRLRQLVSPEGDLSETVHTLRLEILAPGQLTRELEAAGLVPRVTEIIAATEDHLGSTVVIAGRADEDAR